MQAPYIPYCGVMEKSRKLPGWHSFPWQSNLLPSNCFAAP